VLAGGAFYLLRWLVIAFRRAGWPYELEWLEGVSVDHLERLMTGLPLYPPPGLDFIPFSYPPFYYAAAAPLALVTGVGFLPLRLLSIVATLGTLVVLAMLVHRETGSRSAGLAAAGLFVATYRIGGAWFDLGRVDTLFLFLLLLAQLLTVRGERTTSAVGAGVALALAALTKQIAMVVAPALFVAALARPRRALALTGSCALVWGASVAALHFGSGGWFTYYAFQLPQKHYEFDCAPNFWTDDAWRPLPVLCAYAALALVGCLAVRRWGVLARHAAPVLGMCLATWILRRHCGGYENVLMPMHAALALASGLLLGFAPRALGARAFAAPLLVALWLGAGVQLVMLNYDDDAQVPTERDRGVAHELVRRIREAPGPVWVFQHPRYGRQAGKPMQAHWMAISDVLSDPDPPVARDLMTKIADAAERGEFAAIVTDDDFFPVPLPDYVPLKPIFAEPDVLYPVTGIPMRPHVWWQRRVY
jgi:4-amino-4-deoxy-L-arabinose transferase-like glycosyltransferase